MQPHGRWRGLILAPPLPQSAAISPQKPPEFLSI